MTPRPSQPAQPQWVSTLFLCTFYCTCTLCIILHDTFSITTCTTITLFSCTFYFTCTLYISPHILHDTFSVTTCTTTAGKYSIFTYYCTCIHCISLLTSFMTPRPSQPAQPQIVSTLFLCTFYCTCTLYISPHILHDTSSITTCTTTDCKYSVFMHILLYMYIVYLSSHPS